MEYQYTDLGTEVGEFTLVRVFSADDAELASGEHFAAHFAEEVGDADLTVVYRDEYGRYTWHGYFPVPLSDAELDHLLWTGGEWFGDE